MKKKCKRKKKEQENKKNRFKINKLFLYVNSLCLKLNI